MKATSKKALLEERKSAAKDKIVQDLTLNQTRLNILSHLQYLLIYTELPPPDVDLALTALNSESFHMISEERVSMNKCCNLKCKELIPASIVMRVTTKKYIVHGKIQENTEPRIFCGKVKPSDKSACEEAYQA